MVFLRLLVNSVALALTEASSDSMHLASADGEHMSLLQVAVDKLEQQVSAVKRINRDPPAPSPAPEEKAPALSCKAAKDELRTARQAAGTACEDETTDYVEPPNGMTETDKYKIFPPPTEDDPSSMTSCKEGWMAHTTIHHYFGRQCWAGAVVGGEKQAITGPLGTYHVTRSESNHLTPEACLELVWKISRQTGLCNPNVTNQRMNLPANYRFTGCAAEFWDQTSPDVLVVPEHIAEETQFNNYRQQSKFGACMICGQGGQLGDGNLVYGHAHLCPRPGPDCRKVAMGKAGIVTQDSHDAVTRMTCILNAEEKDGFEIADANK